MKRTASLLLLASCTLSLGDGPPPEITIEELTASPEEADVGQAVTVTWSVDGPARRLVLAIGDCACDVTGRTELVDTCEERSAPCLRLPVTGEGEPCPCGAAASGEVPYTLTALGPDDDETADVATRKVTVR